MTKHKQKRLPFIYLTGLSPSTYMYSVYPSYIWDGLRGEEGKILYGMYYSLRWCRYIIEKYMEESGDI